MNDAALDSAGRFWAGSMACDAAPGAGSLYRVDAKAYHHLVQPPGSQVSNLLTVRAAPEVLVPADPACPRQPCGRLGEVLAHLLAGGPLVEAGVLAGVVDAILAERQRVHPVAGRRGVQTDERVRVEPATSPRATPAPGTFVSIVAAAGTMAGPERRTALAHGTGRPVSRSRASPALVRTPGH